jgi:hypothetical protein
LGSRKAVRMELDVGESNLEGRGGAGEQEREGEKALGSGNARGEGAKQDAVISSIACGNKRIGEPRALAIVVGERETRKRRCAKLVM